MNWKLIFQLSLFGLVMAFGTISLIPEKMEFIFWIVIWLVSAYFIAKTCAANYFWYGFALSMFNSVWLTLMHVLFYHSYAAHHPGVVQMYDSSPLHLHPRLFTLLLCPISGIIFGIVQGLFAFVASKIVKKTSWFIAHTKGKPLSFPFLFLSHWYAGSQQSTQRA